MMLTEMRFIERKTQVLNSHFHMIIGKGISEPVQSKEWGFFRCHFGNLSTILVYLGNLINILRRHSRSCSETNIVSGCME